MRIGRLYCIWINHSVSLSNLLKRWHTSCYLRHVPPSMSKTMNRVLWWPTQRRRSEIAMHINDQCHGVSKNAVILHKSASGDKCASYEWECVPSAPVSVRDVPVADEALNFAPPERTLHIHL